MLQEFRKKDEVTLTTLCWLTFLLSICLAVDCYKYIKNGSVSYFVVTMITAAYISFFIVWEKFFRAKSVVIKIEKNRVTFYSPLVVNKAMLSNSQVKRIEFNDVNRVKIVLNNEDYIFMDGSALTDKAKEFLTDLYNNSLHSAN